MEKILVLDAEPIVRSIVVKILARAGYEANEANNLQEAMEKLALSPVQLIITNVYLPGITGHDAMKRLRETCPSVPVLMVSGLPDHEVIDNWQSDRGWDVFPKPFAPDALLDKVRQVLRGDTGPAN